MRCVCNEGQSSLCIDLLRLFGKVFGGRDERWDLVQQTGNVLLHQNKLRGEEREGREGKSTLAQSCCTHVLEDLPSTLRRLDERLVIVEGQSLGGVEDTASLLLQVFRLQLWRREGDTTRVRLSPLSPQTRSTLLARMPTDSLSWMGLDTRPQTHTGSNVGMLEN